MTGLKARPCREWDAQVDALRQTLSVPELDRASLSGALDELASLARLGGPALDLLLSQIVTRELAEASIRSMFFDDAAVDDAVQESVVAVAQGIGSFRGEAAFLTWLDRVARNVARQIRRRSARLSEPVSNEVPERVDGTRRLSSLVADEQVMDQALARLSPEHREILLLREVEELSYDEITLRLRIPPGTVRSRLQRARLQLTRMLLERDGISS